MTDLTTKIVKELLDYNPKTGEFRWKFRDRKWFEDVSDRGWNSWNGKNAGNTAGYLDKSNGYRGITIFDKPYQAHRLAWLYVYGEWPNEIDHINHIRDDNRLENLRDVTRSQNGMNSSIETGRTSQYKGVHWAKKANKWKAQIGINGKQKYLGYFTIEIEAARAYDRAALEHFGIYAKLNFPIEDYDLAA